MRSTLFSLGLAVLLSPLSAEEWRYYGNDPGGTRYSPLDQITPDNVSRLQVAWEFDSPDFADGLSGTPTRSAFEATPLMIDGTLYVPTPFDRLLALDAASGQKLWEFDPQLNRSRRFNLYINRGLGYWRQGDTERLLLSGQTGSLFSIDRKTGKLDRDFANGGVLRAAPADFPEDSAGRYGLTSPVSQCAGTLIVGGLVTDGSPRGPSGDVRGYDIHTGQLRWRFHTVPRPGEFGHETWGGDSWERRGGTNLWSIASVDEELGLVYVPLGSPSYDYYGGDRPGANLFGNSLVALDCRTGSRRWHFQTIHHDIWDWDLPSQPSLVEIVREGRPVKAVTIATKTGFLFVFDRATGEPLFEIEEHPVPAGDLPGEYYHPTQPRPVRPKAFIRQSMRADELTTVTEESRAECLENGPRGFRRRPAIPPAPDPKDRVLPRHQRRHELGRRGVRSRDRHVLHQFHGRRLAGFYGRPRRGLGGSLAQSRWPARALLGFQPLPMPRATLGPTDSHRPQHWRAPLAGRAGRIRRVDPAGHPPDRCLKT